VLKFKIYATITIAITITIILSQFDTKQPVMPTAGEILTGNNIRDEAWGVTVSVRGYGVAYWQQVCSGGGPCGLSGGAIVQGMVPSCSFSQGHPDTFS
jgi:hypothetical protein